ncbi:DNA polymerase-3 subunit alpha (Gram-positive type) [Cerasibacillus quisquiliarum]|uniref:DNA polymerase III PolC-type n=1 Tax=Cerasibacillus quisquiliarum TaxID=227865 RepID=A0A511UYC4_9BACI|nr:PolC-type DNA polymerase III [Cerasibacillus quisquiliarum]MBB5145892.1 DNA polymerase-3 subunit alpha (Gram-positive type) [Cerasibacillus quisquiliarum]GEN30463.1 DNA polymerase III PolC-type [Cerasibacillus quisquiliarum]
MSISNNDKMKILLEQIDLSHLEQTYFKHSKLKRLDVFKQKKLWHFHIEIERLLPFHIYETFSSAIKKSFQSFTQVTFTFYTKSNQFDVEQIKEYWKHFTQQTALSPAYRELILHQRPRIENQKITIQARNKAEAVAIKKRLENEFQTFCKKIGAPIFSLDVQVANQDLNIRKFKEEQALQDQEIVLKTIRQKEKREKDKQNLEKNRMFTIGYQINDEPIQMENITEEERRVTVQGYVFAVDIRKLRSGRSLLIVKATDYTDSLTIKMFSRGDEDAENFKQLKKGIWIKARGSIQTDMYTNELTMMANDMNEIKVAARVDTAPKDKKRVELHAHTTMSQLDAVVSPSRLIEQAAKWGHPAIAITDHAAVQGFPEAHHASEEHHIKVIYGVEANLVDDGIPIAYNEKDIDLQNATYVVFDVETTGLSAVYDTIIELAGVKIHRGEIIDRFESFANPHHPLSQTTIDLTGITDDMVKDAPEIDEVLKDFHAWVGDSILVAHNASFDIGFINQGYKRINYDKITQPVIDTLELARFLFPELRNHRLNTLCKHLNIELTQHHRAIYDAEATGYLLWKFVEKLLELEIVNHNQLNNHMGKGDAYKRSRPFHCTILAKNETGLKNLYKLVSYSHIDYFYRVPRIPRSLLEKHREGLLIGSACDQGEVFETMMQQSLDDAERVAEFYDYIEVQPPSNYVHLIEKELVQNEAQILDIIRKLVELGEKINKPVVATGNVHYIEEHEKQYRQILIASQAGNPLNRHRLPDTPFRTTDEMLTEFHFLGDTLAQKIVVENTHIISSMIDHISPIKEDLYTPTIEGADQEIRDLCYTRAKSIYGDPLPEIVEKRLEKELWSIINHGFAVIYLISHKLVKKSLDDGYLVGSRGSVGSSLVATMTEITEVNPLPPHYVCLSCHYNEFITDGSYGSGFDLPDKACPNCGAELKKDGQDIPFETFLGFKGDKVPDIDLNFSGEYQPKAHNYTKVLFGEDNVYRAGTIGTIAEKTAYGYVKGYASDHSLVLKGAEIDRLVQGCAGVKRTTGQHPGGIIVVPDDKEIFDFTPIQYPADDRTSEWRTTHFDFHSIEDNLLKLDILGHDDPTVIRMLQDLSGINPKTIPVDDPEVMKIFSGPEPLGVTPEQINNCHTGTLGVPEFGTRFVRQMLEDTKPTTFSELVIISGLSHGTDVWLGNAQELINEGICELPDVIGCRDDIMVYLMQKGLEASTAFKIMESVRKGRGLTDEWIEEMKKHGVPDWYIESCKKIKYMFPKAHAAAYVLMAVRIAYFKVHYPIYFYAAYFSVRANDFDLDTMIKGADAIRQRVIEIDQKGNDASPKEKNLLTVLEVALEMCERGFSFSKVDLYRSSATDFIVDGHSLIPPFNAVDGLGTNAALNIVKAREEGEFLSKEDLRERSKISKTVLEYLDQHGCLEGMPDQNQLSLF